MQSHETVELLSQNKIVLKVDNRHSTNYFAKSQPVEWLTIIQHLLPKSEWALSWAQNRNSSIRSIAITFRMVSFISTCMSMIWCRLSTPRFKKSVIIRCNVYSILEFSIHFLLIHRTQYTHKDKHEITHDNDDDDGWWTIWIDH